MAQARGFYRMADLMAAHTDLAIFRRFLSPNILSLLYSQAEILELYDDLRAVVLTDRKSKNHERRELECDWFLLKKSIGSVEGDKQYQGVMELRNKLKDYNEALLTFKQICALPPAEKSALDALRTWLFMPDGGKDFLHALHGETWHEATEFDLTSLTGRYHESDALSKLINGTLVPWLQDHVFDKSKTHTNAYDSFSRRQEEQPVSYYSDTLIAAIVGVLTTTLSYIIPTSAIFALYYIPSDIARMSAIVGFTFLFAVTIMLTTQAKRVECFTATAAFSAVLVVFISNASGEGRNCGKSTE